MNDSRVTAALAVLCAVLVGVLVWTYTGKTAAETRAELADSAGAAHADSALRIASKLEEALGGIAARDSALADSAAAWRARMGESDRRQRAAEARASEIGAELAERLDSVGRVLLDSLTAEHATIMAHAAVRETAERNRADAQTERADSLAATLLLSMGESAEWEASAREYRVASETKDAVIRSLRLQRNVGVVTVLAGVTVAIVAAR